ncbi:predicted protein [Scheffersomyces stipitis CBS 6054]|uniref:F-box domain-containing protein n=1 Tax=Scheffersomyces stipitis (strain ATCC 58785 / CBS 6054 / NBRC 10063 / NRRL Y-11545) TaxID=322104 RepID=A3LV48_PICST|nr:predicted protein [Scheffersomyces stipitis CBS 6054]ABN66713.2 predicted protein [Scheffersomyces stipitis CBS 6054]
MYTFNVSEMLSLDFKQIVTVALMFFIIREINYLINNLSRILNKNQWRNISNQESSERDLPNPVFLHPNSTAEPVSFPDEIILEILEYAPQHDVLRMARVSKRFARICRMKLFKNIYVGSPTSNVLHPEYNTPFYQKYTIIKYENFLINSGSLFFTRRPIQEFVFKDPKFSTGFFDKLKSFHPQAAFYIENKPRTKSPFKTLRHNLLISDIRRLDIVPEEIDSLTSFPDSIRHLSIDFTDLQENGAALNRCRNTFAGLTSLKLKNVDSHMILALFAGEKISVRKLSLSTSNSEFGFDTIEKCFDLSTISSFELLDRNINRKNESYKQFITKLASVRSLTLSCPQSFLRDIITSFKKNTLEEISCLIDTSHDVSMSFIQGLIEDHAQSLVRISCCSSNECFILTDSGSLDKFTSIHTDRSSEYYIDMAKELHRNSDDYPKLKLFELNGVPIILDKTYGELTGITPLVPNRISQ